MRTPEVLMWVTAITGAVLSVEAPAAPPAMPVGPPGRSIPPADLGPGSNSRVRCRPEPEDSLAVAGGAP